MESNFYYFCLYGFTFTEGDRTHIRKPYNSGCELITRLRDHRFIWTKENSFFFFLSWIVFVVCTGPFELEEISDFRLGLSLLRLSETVFWVPMILWTRYRYPVCQLVYKSSDLTPPSRPRCRETTVKTSSRLLSHDPGPGVTFTFRTQRFMSVSLDIGTWRTKRLVLGGQRVDK